MHPITALERLGGIGSRRALLRLTASSDLDRLIRTGDVVRDSRGRFSLPGAADDLRAANALSGVMSHLSAARFWGWELKAAPAVPHVTLPRTRRVDRKRRQGVVIHWSVLGIDEVRVPGVTAPERTLLDCLTTLPFDEALAVADSALRHQAVSASAMAHLAATARGPGSARARRIAGLADGRAANPFESVLRAIALDSGLEVEPQVPISAPGFFARPDLVDRERHVVLEADSHTWHSSRAALRRDCRRYNALVLLGWTVLRFTWEDVMHDPDSVRTDLLAVVEHAHRGSRSRRAL